MAKEVDYLWEDVRTEAGRLRRAVERLEESVLSRELSTLGNAVTLVTHAHSALLVVFGKVWAIAMHNLFEREES